MILKATCPKCGDPLEAYGDDSCGMPDEVGTECDCGAIPVWKLKWRIEYELGPFSHYEREEKEDDHSEPKLSYPAAEYKRLLDMGHTPDEAAAVVDSILETFDLP